MSAILRFTVCTSLLVTATPLLATNVNSVSGLVAAVNNGVNGDTVTIAAGTYQLTAPLRPKAGMTIKGAGIGKTIIKGASSWVPSTAKLPDYGVSTSDIETGAYLFSLPFNTDNITISDMSLTGPLLHGAIYGNDNGNLHLHHLKIDDFRWSGIRIFRNDNARIHDCEFVDAAGRWKNGNPGTSGGITGGCIYFTYMKNSEIWNNRFTKTQTGNENSVMGIKGREARTTRIHHNTINVNFAIELPFENDHTVEIDHNVCKGVISIPKHAGGPVPTGGYTFHIHHNYFTTSYAIEFVRNGVEVDHNLFDFKTTSDGGNLFSGFGSAAAQGSASFHNNLVKNPGRGVYWVNEVYNNIEFRNNHVIANKTSTPRGDGMFGFNSACNFSTITIKDNIIECIDKNRPLVRNSQSNSAIIKNNTLIGISDTANYANPNTGAVRGPTAPLLFTCGVNDEFTVDGWEFSATPTTIQLLPSADSYARAGSSSGSNFGKASVLDVKNSSNSYYHRQAFLRFGLSGLTQDATSAKLILTVKSVGGESVTNRPIDLRLVTSDSWSETSLNWSNKPTIGQNLRSFIITKAMVGSEIELDVTAIVNSERKGDGQISFALLQPTSIGALVSFGSRESAIAGYLEIDSAPAVPAP